MSRVLTVSPSPHIHGTNSVQNLMYGVLIALAPAFLVSFYFYGVGVLIVTAVAAVSCILFEYLIQKFILKSEVEINDGSAALTGVLLAFNLPSNIPIWIIIIGALVSIGVGKLTFGGLGNNPFNPALVGRVFLLISFPVQMTSYPNPKGISTPYLNNVIDGSTGATPLSFIKEGLKQGKPVSDLMQDIPSVFEMMVGKMAGSLGEVAAIALLAGMVFMLVRKIY